MRSNMRKALLSCIGLICLASMLLKEKTVYIEPYRYERLKD